MVWALRHFPVFPVFGRGDYPVQPLYTEDMAAFGMDAGSWGESLVAAAAGPDTFAFEELLQLLASAVDSRIKMVYTPPSVG